MAGKSNIEWTGHTWNPLAGCTVLTPGCKRCYAMKMAARLEAMGQELYKGLTEKVNGNTVWTGVMRQAPDSVLLAPTQRRKPTTYFVNSMSDLFHESVPDEWIDRIIGVMARTPWHTYQVLTKRSDRMRKYMAGIDAKKFVDFWSMRSPYVEGVLGFDARKPQWPLPNLWLGASTERQFEANTRIPDLLATPAAVRFISAEPLLGPIDLVSQIYYDAIGISMRGYLRDKSEPDDYRFNSAKLDWVIVGGESGHGARAMHPDWVRALRDQCASTETAFFFKQWGEFAPTNVAREEFADPDARHAGEKIVGAGGKFTYYPEDGAEEFYVMRRFGKAKAGHLLDGREHREMPHHG